MQATCPGKALLGHPDFMDRGWGFLYTGFLSRALLGLALLIALSRIYSKSEGDGLRMAGLALVAILAVSPTLHPWSSSRAAVRARTAGPRWLGPARCPSRT
jgi:hypothetical protein